ncbi:hypothetical protein TRICHSKD4_4196 [Roseibium sp. TrichSKD4]|nr:hypothetical protein TRICHSKD4_4196 [Roseibium sp. TrichSKD4]
MAKQTSSKAHEIAKKVNTATRAKVQCSSITRWSKRKSTRYPVGHPVLS